MDRSVIAQCLVYEIETLAAALNVLKPGEYVFGKHMEEEPFEEHPADPEPSANPVRFNRMSEEARKKVSARMKKYWAAKRKAAKGKKKR